MIKNIYTSILFAILRMKLINVTKFEFCQTIYPKTLIFPKNEF